jgi:hypothetical protein
MKTHHKTPRGFTLIITISLLVLLTMVAVGVLSLSSVTLRQSSYQNDYATARSNARMSLMLALGALQKDAGADTRVTARADILNKTNPPILGVWKSWEGSDHTQTGSFQGRPISPGNYKSSKNQRFLRWLTSHSLAAPGDSASLPDTKISPQSVPLIGESTVGKGPNRDQLQIHIPPSNIRIDASKNGCYAWYVSGENQKAHIPAPYQPTNDNPAGWSGIAKSHAIADPEIFRLESLNNNPTQVDKISSLDQINLIAGSGDILASKEFFHDLSPWSKGLLTNTATGGWRKDLSIFTENYASVGSSSLPLFRATPTQDVLCSLPAGSNTRASKSMLYPWAAYRGGGSEMPIYQFGAVCSWENLKEYATMYKRLSATGNRILLSNSTPNSYAIDDTANTYSYIHKVRAIPVIARIQWVFSHWAGPATATAGQPAPPAGSLEPRLLLTPIITMWNPYNVEITSAAALSFSIPKPLPAALRYTVNSTTNTNYQALMAGATNNTPALSTTASLRYNIASAFTLKPGETRVFSPQNTSPIAATEISELAVGYRSKGGHFFPVVNSAGQPMAVPAGSSIKADAKFDTSYSDGAPGVGIYLDMSIAGRRHLVYRMVYPPAVADKVYPPLTQMAQSTLSASVANPTPFMSTMFGARMASNTHIAAKGFVQSSPLVNYTAMGGKDVVESTIGRKYNGTGHPVNSPFDYSFVKHAGAGDSWLPNTNDATGRGYIVTGFNKADGLSRCVIAELPTRPLSSLGELQNWDLRYENPIPPYAINLIGNSDASPLLPPNAVFNSNSKTDDTVNLQHDDSYCANHILFDDWFFSSIAPNPTNFGSSGKSMQVVYQEFVTGTTPLPNRAYQAIALDRQKAAISATEATTLFNKNVRDRNGWKTIASRLEVEGMFNVNSTSETAWRALLRHARQQKTAHITESGASWSIATSGKEDFPHSRFTIAGDVEARRQGSSGSFPESAEFAGYRTFDEDQLDELALLIVEQVRLRGPFLSLSEFVNRQLSSGNLALAGAIQSALNELSKKSALNPFSAIQGLSKDAGAMPVGGASPEYQFPDAAVGESAYGLPGWTRQADILRPLAPILSARDDTFRIRAYGDARDANNNIKARAWCEAIVQRTRDYTDPSEAAELATPTVKALNKAFGRRFTVVSFRWLREEEI